MKELNIHTNRLLIRHLTINDLKDLFIYRSNPEVVKYQGFDVMNIDQLKSFIIDNSSKSFGKPGEWVQYGIEQIQTGKLIGDCAIKLDTYDKRIAEIGITISHLEQKNGIAKEALTGIVKFLFETKNLHRIVAIVDTENIASINLLQSISFKKEGHFIENIFFKGKWGSEYQYAMLQREWNSDR
ncbi:GNAT family N-acetyltransferase [Chryseobacterium gwangjuense]|uniref:GNAT family N-acetyltransferase n=1 Tax=Chryseobacterium gwangjuense TaxID=1069980 RepID=UPI001E3E4C17|nr:GNAT family protein [Chryseobacterium gwangjuense]MCE3076237.1 GNAT family N-acetyltransferase [Chryseobacterium gwangjuense]